MSQDSALTAPPEIARDRPRKPGRKILAIVDDSAEMKVAILYACHRAVATDARVSLLCVVPPLDFRGFAAVEERMLDEAFDEARARLYDMARHVWSITGLYAEIVVCGGSTFDEMKRLLDAEPEIRMVVLAAAAGPDGPGPLVSRLAAGGGMISRPVTIVPGHLSLADIETLA
ncbi:MAG: universal stress protein [Alphaproteobacteria bacterium]